jgi:hypothetical protein
VRPRWLLSSRLRRHSGERNGGSECDRDKSLRHVWPPPSGLGVKNPALVAARAGRYHGVGVLQLSIDQEKGAAPFHLRIPMISGTRRLT